MARVIDRGWIPEDDPRYREPYTIHIGGLSKGGSETPASATESEPPETPSKAMKKKASSRQSRKRS
jgi:hypothetical protein